ncbi:Hypothetical predicted protein [Mytilus galloprovincialis]|uniref:Uncharacterized protein n=1 Tax=Mytilus galloprovincialis TaxID=29158 RepID=A0A8B6CPB3_MYTGA|nr:Hypothetical predicted protein [Mytilus galloprovincialis]
MPSIWRILNNFLVKRTAEPNSSASSHGRNQSGEVKESTSSQSVKIDVQDSDDVRKTRGQLNQNRLLHHMAENQSGEVKESRASQSVKIDVQDTDDGRWFYLTHYQSSAFHIEDPRQYSSQENSKIVIQWQKKSSGEGEEAN